VEKTELTEKDYWEACWDKIRLPAIVKPASKNMVGEAILDLFVRYLPKGNLSAVEIGGAPGQYAAYLDKYHGYDVSIIEYTEVGCSKTEENFKLLGIDGNVYYRDFFSDLSDIPKFDVVFSSGFIEHFTDLEDVLSRHVSLLKKGGVLVVGVPNFRGISQKVLAKTAPKMLARHNLEAMDIGNWDCLEKKHGLVPLFKGYIGGFDPKILKRCERRTPINLVIHYFFKLLSFLLIPFPFLRKFNSPKWSAYLLGIYKLN
jgi:SAM-dependent methyltransferase